MQSSSWDIHEQSGHCRHRSGIDAYLDLAFPQRNVIPLVGAYSRVPVDPGVIRELILRVEHEHPECCVLYGVFSETENAWSSVTVMGMEVGWTPIYSFRSLMFIDQADAKDHIAKEWNVSPTGLSHKASGFELEFTSVGTVTTVLGERVEEEMISLAPTIYRLLSRSRRGATLGCESSAIAVGSRHIAMSE